MPLRHHGRLGTCQPGSGDVGTPCLAAQHGLSISPMVWGQDWVAVPGSPCGAQGWHLHLGQPWPQEVLRDHSLSPELQQKILGTSREDGPSPDTRVTLPTSPGTPGSLGGCWVIPGAVLRLCPCSQVLELEVWEQVSAGTPCQAVLRWGEGQICLLWAGGLPPGLPCPTCPPARGCSEGGWL